MSGFGRRLVPPSRASVEIGSRPADPDPEQIKSWFSEARASEQPAEIDSLAQRILKFLGLRRSI